MFWKLVRIGLWFTGILILLMMCSICSVSLLVFDKPTVTDNSINSISKLLYKDDIEQLRLTQDYHGEVSGYEGYDYTTECGDLLYSPLPGRGIVTYNGRDGYVGRYDLLAEQNTMLKIEGHAGTVILLHGDYSLVQVGDELIGGITPIGKNDSIGNATGCHSHVVWQPNPTYNSISVQHVTTMQHVQPVSKSPYGTILFSYENVPLVLSEYRPSEGGVNCDSDCSTMASGDKVSSWLLGQNGVRAAACPREWAFGTHFVIANQKYECRDRGGYINCYQPGDYDPAYSNMYKQSYYADEAYCWVDILQDSGAAYGTRIYDWAFVK